MEHTQPGMEQIQQATTGQGSDSVRRKEKEQRIDDLREPLEMGGRGECKLIANFSATMVTSLPSVSLSLSLSLSFSVSLSPSAPHAQYGKRFCASSYRKLCHADPGLQWYCPVYGSITS